MMQMSGHGWFPPMIDRVQQSNHGTSFFKCGPAGCDAFPLFDRIVTQYGRTEVALIYFVSLLYTLHKSLSGSFRMVYGISFQ